MGLLSTIGSASGRAFGLTRLSTIKDSFFNLVTLLLNTGSTNGAQNNTFLDSSSNAFSITRNGNTTQGTFTPFSQTGWSAFVNGSTQDVLITDNAAFQPGSGDFTYEAWVYMLSLPSGANYKVFWAQRTSTATFGGVLPAVDSSGNVVLFISNSAASAWQITGASTGFTVSLNTWTHIAITRSGNTITPYKNGTAGTTSTVATGAIGTTAGLSLMAGAYDGSQLVDGYMSNFRMVKGTAIAPPSGGPTSALTAVSGTGVLTLQSNRFVDNSGNNQTVTPVGGAAIQAFSPFAPTAAYSTTTVGGSGYFDGTGDYLSAASNAAFTLGTGDFTLEFWLYPTSSTQRNITFATVGAPIFYMNTSRQLQFENYGAPPSINTTSTLNLNSWNHCVASRVSGTTRIFINGVEGVSSTAFSATNFVQSLVNIGTDAGTTFCNGYMTDVRIVKGSGVTSVTVPTAPLTNITNTSLLLNFTNAGIFDAAAKNDLETVGNAQVSTTQAKFGTTSMSFDGTGDNLFVPLRPTLSLGGGDFTLEAWVYPTVSTGTQGIISFGNGATVQPYLYLNGLTPTFLYNNVAVATGPALTQNTWNYLAVTRSGSTIRIFTNGTGGTAVSPYTDVFTNAGLYIGSNSASAQYFTGYIDDLRITQYARTVTSSPTAAFPVQ